MKKFMTKRNGQFLGFAVLCIAAIFSFSLLGCDNDGDPASPGDNEPKIWYELGSDFTYDNRGTEVYAYIRFSHNGEAYSTFTEAEKAAIYALTINSLTITPLTSSDQRTLTVEDGYRSSNNYDDGGFMDSGYTRDTDINFSIKLKRSARVEPDLLQQSKLTVADSKGYKFVAFHEHDDEVKW